MRVDEIEQRFGDQVKIVWKSFMLRTEPKTSDRDKFIEYTKSWQRCAAAEPQAEFKTPWVGESGGPTSSLPAQVAWKAASAFGAEPSDLMKRALMHAYFVDNRDISDNYELVDIAASIGLGRSEFSKLLESSHTEFAQAVINEHNSAINQGITAVPTVLVDSVMPLPGAQEFLTYERMIARLIDKRAAQRQS